MGWRSSLTYRELAGMKLRRSVGILAVYRDIDAAKALFEGDPALADDPDALTTAAGNGDEAFVRLLLRYQPALARRVTAIAPTRELTELLFESGMDPNRADWLGITPLHRIAAHAGIEQAAIFIDHGADLRARDDDLRSTPLGHAARAGKLDMVEYLLQRGASPALPDDPPWATPLAWATRRGHHDIVRVLASLPA